MAVPKPTPPPKPKPLIGKAILQKIKGEGEGEEEGAGEGDSNAGKIEELQQIIEQATVLGVSVEDAEGKLKKLQAEVKTPAVTLTQV